MSARNTGCPWVGTLVSTIRLGRIVRDAMTVGLRTDCADANSARMPFPPLCLRLAHDRRPRPCVYTGRSMSGIGTKSRMGLSRKVAILLGVSALALGGCGDALWPTTDGPDPTGGGPVFAVPADRRAVGLSQTPDGGRQGRNPVRAGRRSAPSGGTVRPAAPAAGPGRTRRPSRRPRPRAHAAGGKRTAPSSARRSPRCRATSSKLRQRRAGPAE